MQRPDQDYAIRDADGELIATHSRWRGRNGRGKRFTWSRGGQPGLDGLPVVDLPLYLSENLRDYNSAQPLFIVEGETAADALRAAGAQVVGTVTGANSCPSIDVWRNLPGFESCIVWPDLDKPGQQHAEQCAEALSLAKPDVEIRIVDPVLLGLTAPGSDAVEWLAISDEDEGLSPVIASSRVFESRLCDSRDSCHSDRSRPPSAATDCEGSREIDPEPIDPEPTPLAPDCETPFPVEVFPPLLRAAAEAIQLLTRAPMALCAQSVLAVASVAAQRISDVRLPTLQIVPLSLFLLSIANSGERKSSVDRWATESLEAEEKRQEKLHREALASHEVALEAWKARKAAVRRASGEELIDRLDELGTEPAPPNRPGLLVGMGTIEGILSMLERQDAVGLFSDEGGSFLTGYAMARENDRRMKTAAVLSSLWDGRPIREERRGGHLRLGEGKRMALHLLTQPVVARKLLGDEEIDGQGLLSRLLIVEPESTIGTRFWEEAPKSALESLRAFNSQIAHLLAHEGTRRVLPLGSRAWEAWVGLHDEIERESGLDGKFEAIRSFAAKAPEHATRIAAVLEIVEDAEATEITSLEAGIALVRFYLAERLRLYGKPEEPYAADAARLVRFLKESWSEERISVTDFLQRGPNRYRSKRALIESKLLPLLLDYGHLQGPPKRAEVQGKMRRKTYRVIRQGAE